MVGDADVAQRLASAIGLSTAAFPLHETAWATRKFLARLAENALVVAVVEDIHWAETAFLELLRACFAPRPRAIADTVYGAARTT
jgi:predicted ATPase